MVKQVPGWLAEDGSFHLKEDDAKAAEFRIAFTAWVDSIRTDNPNRIVSPTELIELVFTDRMKLLPIFKLLNGGNGIPPVAAIKLPTES